METLAYFHSEVENYDWAIYDSNYNCVGMFKEKYDTRIWNGTWFFNE